MRISNERIAEMIASKGYDFQEALDGLDAIRTPEQEQEEFTEEELSDMIDNFCISFECGAEYN